MAIHRKFKFNRRTTVAIGVVATASSSLAFAGNAHAASVSTWDKIAMCESSGNWQNHTGDGGRSTGGLQIQDSTWKAYGGLAYAPRAYQASKANQIRVAQKILAGQGSRAWTVTWNGGPCNGLALNVLPAPVFGGTPAPVPAPAPTPVPVSGVWGRPVPGAVTTAYHATGAAWSLGWHTGVDFACATGTPVKSAGPGVVVGINQAGASYGNHVVVKHTDGVYTLYAHLSTVSVRVGQTVSHATVLGLSGATGHATGPHLHWEARTSPTGFSASIFIDPLAWLNSDTKSNLHDPAPTPAGGKTYKVVAGDYLAKIASAQHVSGGWHALYDANKAKIGSNPSLIFPGQVLTLP